MKNYIVYILSSHSKVLYIGVTNNLVRRVWEHRNDFVEGFSKKYKTHKLVYYEETASIESAILREKQLKNWNRSKKELLINKMNPSWEDLYISFTDSSTALGMTS